MALIQCPECGKEISDKAKKCVHCGKIFVVEDVADIKIKCNECGVILSETDEVCPNCGYTVENIKTKNETNKSGVNVQQSKISNLKIKMKTNKAIYYVSIVILICVVGGIGYNLFSGGSEKSAYNKYIKNLEDVQNLMFDGVVEAGALNALTLKVWENAIYEKNDDETDKYTWNTAISHWRGCEASIRKLYEDPSTVTTVSDIKENQSSVKELIKDLEPPPVGLNKCYNTVSMLYKSYVELTNLAIDPHGTYNSFESDVNSAISDFLNAYEKMDGQIPEKKM